MKRGGSRCGKHCMSSDDLDSKSMPVSDLTSTAISISIGEVRLSPVLKQDYRMLAKSQRLVGAPVYYASLLSTGSTNPTSKSNLISPKSLLLRPSPYPVRATYSTSTAASTSNRPSPIMSVAGVLSSVPLPTFVQKRLFTQDTPADRSLSIDNINPHVKEAKYAVRGELAIKSEEYRAQLAKGEGKDLPFDSVISANIGNPQQLDQKPITFFRQVASLVENPLLLEHEDVLKNSLGYNSDAIQRAQKLLKDVKSVGAYSQSQGAPGIRQSVAEFIERRDGFPADPANIYLCGGASAGVNALMTVICSSPQTGILVPIPQYPLYTATLSLLNAQVVPYYLEEESNWSTNVDGMRTALKEAQAKGIDVRAVVVINPGNPTGGSLESSNIKSVIELAAEEKLVVLADEVYQTNVFEGEFNSFKKCLRELQKSEKNKEGKFDNIEMASLHSISKGMVGECGHRGGYYEMVGFDEKVRLEAAYLSEMILTRSRSSNKSTNSSASCSARQSSANALSSSWSTRPKKANPPTLSTAKNTTRPSTTSRSVPTLYTTLSRKWKVSSARNHRAACTSTRPSSCHRRRSRRPRRRARVPMSFTV